MHAECTYSCINTLGHVFIAGSEKEETKGGAKKAGEAVHKNAYEDTLNFTSAGTVNIQMSRPIDITSGYEAK